MNVALIGPTCSGKTTCSVRIREAFRLRHLSTGQVLRENREQQTALGILTRKYVEMGELVPDEIINAMIEEAVRKTPVDQGLLLDGFPSTLYQARFLDTLFQATRRPLDVVIWLQIPEQTVFDRAARREPRRSDDRPEILRHRLQVFRRTTGPVIDYYRQSQRLCCLDAAGSIEAQASAVEAILTQVAVGGYRPVLTQAEQRVIDELVANRVAPRVVPRRPSLDLVMMGAPGSGKGTHSAFVSAQLHVPHIASGDLFRENLSGDTLLGRIAQTYLDRGELVPDDVTEAMVRERLNRSDAREGFVLDGFPRTLPQAQALDELMADFNRRLDKAIYLQVPDEEIIERISGRWLCPVCQSSYHVKYKKPLVENRCDRDGSPLRQREDDTPQTVRSRLEIFHEQTLPVIQFYREAGILVEVPGSGEVDQVDAALLPLLREIQAHPV
jgi:adenylate kinase